MKKEIYEINSKYKILNYKWYKLDESSHINLDDSSQNNVDDTMEIDLLKSKEIESYDDSYIMEESANLVNIQSTFMDDSHESCVNKIYMDIKSNVNTEIRRNNIIDNENIEFTCNDVLKSHKNIKIEKIVRAGIN